MNADTQVECKVRQRYEFNGLGIPNHVFGRVREHVNPSTKKTKFVLLVPEKL